MKYHSTKAVLYS